MFLVVVVGVAGTGAVGVSVGVVAVGGGGGDVCCVWVGVVMCSNGGQQRSISYKHVLIQAYGQVPFGFDLPYERNPGLLRWCSRLSAGS